MVQQIGKLVDNVQDGSDNDGCDDCCVDNTSPCSIRNAFPEQVSSHLNLLKVIMVRLMKAGFFF